MSKDKLLKIKGSSESYARVTNFPMITWDVKPAATRLTKEEINVILRHYGHYGWSTDNNVEIESINTITEYQPTKRQINLTPKKKKVFKAIYLLKIKSREHYWELDTSSSLGRWVNGTGTLLTKTQLDKILRSYGWDNPRSNVEVIDITHQEIKLQRAINI